MFASLFLVFWCNLIRCFCLEFHIYLYSVFYFILCWSLLFFCAESTIGDIAESKMTSAWRRSLPPLCPSPPSCPSPTSCCIPPTPSVRVQRRPVVVPGCHERLSSSSTENVRGCYLRCLGISNWNSGWLFNLLLYHTFSTLPWPSRRGCDLKSRLLFLYSHLLGSGLSKLWTL